MKAVSFEFHRPASLAEASDVLVRYEGDARVLAGGQSLMPMLNLRLVRPAAIVDLSALAELKAMEVSSTEVSIGALVTHSALEFCQESGVTFDILRYVAGDRLSRCAQSRHDWRESGSCRSRGGLAVVFVGAGRQGDHFGA